MYTEFEKVLNHIHSGVLYCRNDQHSTIIYANDHFYKMIGYTREEMERDYNNRFADHVVDDVSEILIRIDEKIANNEDLDYEFRMRRKDGSIFWVHDTAKYDRENNCWFVTIMDITDMKTIDYERERLDFYLNSIPNKIVIADDKGRIIYRNKEAVKCHYYNKEAKTFYELFGNNILGQKYDEIFTIASAGKIVKFETRYKDTDRFIGNDKNRLIPVETKDKEGINYMMVSKNVLMQGDILTPFPNRLMFAEYYRKYMSKERNEDAFLCIVDIDDFKKINDTYGHSVGDAAIKLTGNRIMNLLEKDDYASRFGGDEFMILLLNQSPQQIKNKLLQLIDLTKTPVMLEGESVMMTYSIGIISVAGCKNFSKAFDRADQALYEVKLKGKNHLSNFGN